MKRAFAGRLFVAVIMMLGACDVGYATGPAFGEPMVEGLHGDGRVIAVSDFFSRMLDIAESADDADKLQALLENDSLMQASGLVPGSDIIVGSVGEGDCRLSPLLCLFKVHTPDLHCAYDCMGLRGHGELRSAQREECAFLAGCILFENCLALCISILPYDPRPVIWW